MATTGKSTKQLNSNEQNEQSATSEQQDLGKNFCEQLPWLVPGKLYYAKSPEFPWSLPGWDGGLDTVQFVDFASLGPHQSRDANPMEWMCRCYVINDSSYIPVTFVKVKDLLDKEFVDGDLYKCLS
jgi:hypothetical protein